VRAPRLVEFVFLAALFLNALVISTGVSVVNADDNVSQTDGLGRCQWSSLSARLITCAAYPVANSFVDNLFPTQAMNTYSCPAVTCGQPSPVNGVLIVQDTPSVPRSLNYVFLKFDFNTVLPPQIIESHAKPLNSTLWLYSLYTVGLLNASVRAYRVPSNSWAEDALTWSNMPQPDLSHYSVQHIAFDDQWYNWTVTGDTLNITQGIVSFAMIAGFTSPANYAIFASTSAANRQHWPELDVSFQVPTLKLQSIPNLPVLIDGRQLGTDSAGNLQAFLLWGSHNVSVPEAIPVSEGVRMGFVKWSDGSLSATRQINLGNNITLAAVYEKQYRLDVISPYGTSTGSGWYSQSTTAVASVTPTTLPAEGILGVIGVRHMFDHWAGNCTSNGNSCLVTMNGPTRVEAVWRDDYLIPILLAASIVVLASMSGFLRHRRRGRS